VILGILDEVEALGVLRLEVALDKILQRLLVVIPLVNVDGGGLELGSLGGVGSRLAGALGRRPPRARLLLGSLLLLALALPLASTGRGAGPGGGGRDGRGSSGAVVVVNSPHVVPQVPLAWEAMSGQGALASLIGAQIRLLTVTVHGVGLTLMPEEAGSRREPGVLAALNLAAIGLQVGINKLAAQPGWLAIMRVKSRGNGASYS